MWEKLRRASSLAVVCAMCLWLAEPAWAAGSTATSMKLMRTEGTVSVCNISGRSMKVLENMRLYNGYRISSKAKSYAWINLDDTKLIKLDAASEVEVRKNGKALDLLVHSGNLFFNVTEPLAKDETMNICTATMVAGIRGTSGWVEAVDEQQTQMCVLDGSVECTVADPVTGESRDHVISAGEVARFQVDGQDRPEVSTQTAAAEDIPGFVLVDAVSDGGLCDKILEDSGLDLRDVSEEAAQARLEADQADTARRLDEAQGIVPDTASDPGPAIDPDPAPAPTPAPTPVPTPTASPDPSESQTASPDPSESQTASPDPSESQTASPDPSESQTASPDPSESQTGSPDPSESQTASPDPSESQTASLTTGKTRMPLTALSMNTGDGSVKAFPVGNKDTAMAGDAQKDLPESKGEQA